MVKPKQKSYNPNVPMVSRFSHAFPCFPIHPHASTSSMGIGDASPSPTATGQASMLLAEQLALHRYSGGGRLTPDTTLARGRGDSSGGMLLWAIFGVNVSKCSLHGASGNRGTPIAGWFVMGTSTKINDLGVSPILGNHHPGATINLTMTMIYTTHVHRWKFDCNIQPNQP